MPHPSLPPTTSGRFSLVELSDAEALGLCPGDVVIVRTPGRPVMYDYTPLRVDHVRLGVAYDDATPPHAFTVAVVEGYLGLAPQEGERPMVWAARDCSGPRLELVDGSVAAVNGEAVPDEAPAVEAVA